MALQRTRRPRFRSGRSLRSLGSPLNARPLAGTRNTALLLTILLLSTSCHFYWRNADEFQSGLRCNLSIEEVKRLASKYGASGVTEAVSYQGGPSHFLRRHDTAFDFWFGNSGLQSFRQGKFYGITGLRHSLTVNLCTGRRTGYPMLGVNAPEAFKGAAIYLDGRKLGGLSTGEGPAGANIGIPVLEFGTHEIRVEKVGFATVVREFTYEPKNFWPEEEVISIEISDAEVRTAG